MNCPICNIPLTMAERQGVEIDYCQKCRGIWLDRGELDTIIERSTQKIPSQPYAEQQESRYNERYDKHRDDHHDRHDHDHHKRKKGFLQDLFD